MAKLRQAPADVILVDVRMPGMSGIGLTSRVKATPDLAEIPIRMMTGDSRRETLGGSIEAGAVEFAAGHRGGRRSKRN